MKVKKRIKNNLEDFINNFKKAIKRPEMKVLPGQLAFFYVLALVPTLTLISYGASWLNLSTDVIYKFLSDAFSSDVANLLLSTKAVLGSGIGFYITIIFGYYMASNGAASVILTSNTIYGIEEKGFVNRRFKAIIMTLVLILLFVFMLVVPIFGNKIIELIASVDLNHRITNNVIYIFNLLQGPISWVIMYAFIKIIYIMAPNKKLHGKNVGYGAIFTTFGWVITTYVFSYYVTHYAKYNALYGSLANIVILMIWFYFLAYIFTIGIALNYRIEEIELEKTGTLKIEE